MFNEEQINSVTIKLLVIGLQALRVEWELTEELFALTGCAVLQYMVKVLRVIWILLNRIQPYTRCYILFLLATISKIFN